MINAQVMIHAHVVVEVNVGIGIRACIVILFQTNKLQSG